MILKCSCHNLTCRGCSLINKYNKDGTQGYGHSKGMTPQMPFYTAAREIERQIADVVGRVFA